MTHDDVIFFRMFWVFVAMMASLFILGIVGGWVREYLERRRVRRILGCPNACNCCKRTP